MATGQRPLSVPRVVCFGLALTAIALYDHRVPAQSGASSFGVIALPTLGGAAAAGHGISELGTTVVGRAQTAAGTYHAFAQGYWGSRDLGTLGGAQSAAHAAISSQVVGQAQTASGREHAFFVELSQGGTMVDLGTLGGNWSAAYDLKHGIVVGASRTAGNRRVRAFQHVNGVMSPVPFDWGGDSVARGVNSSFDIVGYACTASNASCRAFLFSGGAVTDLGSLGGDSVATDISENGLIVGSSIVSGSTRHAFLYASAGMTDLGTLGGANSEAMSVNDRGEVVGWSQIAAGGRRAFLFRNGVMTNLNSLLPPGSGWVLENARGISEGGQIIGTGRLKGVARAFLLTPPTDLRLFEGGILTLADSNRPRGVEVGRMVSYTTSVWPPGGPPVTIFGVKTRHTLSGPAEFVEARVLDGQPCDLTPTVVTCEVGPFEAFGIGQEVLLRARATGPGHITHTAVLVNSVPDPDTSNDIISESNWAVALAAFALTPSSIEGGNAAAARVTLTDLPPAGDAVLRVTSSRPDIVPIRVPFIVPAHAGSPSRGFNIIPAVVSAPTPVEITVTYGLVSITRTLTVLPPALRHMYLSPTTVIGGCGTSAGKILLTGAAPAGGASVALTTTNPKAIVPPSVTVAGGTESKLFTVSTMAVTALSIGQVQASYGGVSQSLKFTVRPIRASALTLVPNAARGGTTVTGRVTLECPAAPGAVVINLTSSSTAVAAPTVASITIPAGGTTGSFTVRTAPVSVGSTASISAWVFGVRKMTVLTVTP
jgi:probable HAF family extracellular repeat protein